MQCHPGASGGFQIGASCEFTCDLGFDLLGPSRLHCGPKGQWNALEPTCKGRMGFTLWGESLGGPRENPPVEIRQKQTYSELSLACSCSVQACAGASERLSLLLPSPEWRIHLWGRLHFSLRGRVCASRCLPADLQLWGPVVPHHPLLPR